MTKVSDVEVRDEFVALDASTSVLDAAKACKGAGVKYIVVLENDRIVGVVTAVDFMYKVLAEEERLDIPLRNVMSTPAVVCNMDDDISKVAERMWESSYSMLPVVSSDGTLAGVITIKDVLYTLAEPFLSEEARTAAQKLRGPCFRGRA